VVQEEARIARAQGRRGKKAWERRTSVSLLPKRAGNKSPADTPLWRRSISSV